MVLIDSSVWIDYLAGDNSALALLLHRWLVERQAVATTGIILQEVLQGVRSDRQFHLVHSTMSRVSYLPARKSTHESAAKIFRKARARGHTVPSVDVLIAAIAIESDAALLSADVAHFEVLARYSKLQLIAA